MTTIITLYNTYKNLYPTSDLIVFYNCSPKLKKLFNHHEFLKTNIVINNAIVFEYNSSVFHKQNALYRFIVNSVAPDYVESFTCKEYTDLRQYTIIHKSIQAELHVCASGDIHFAVAMQKINVSEFINTVYLCSVEAVYEFMVRYIDHYVLHNR